MYFNSLLLVERIHRVAPRLYARRRRRRRRRRHRRCRLPRLAIAILPRALHGPAAAAVTGESRFVRRVGPQVVVLVGFVLVGHQETAQPARAAYRCGRGDRSRRGQLARAILSGSGVLASRVAAGTLQLRPLQPECIGGCQASCDLRRWARRDAQLEIPVAAADVGHARAAAAAQRSDVRNGGTACYCTCCTCCTCGCACSARGRGRDAALAFSRCGGRVARALDGHVGAAPRRIGVDPRRRRGAGVRVIALFALRVQCARRLVCLLLALVGVGNVPLGPQLRERHDGVGAHAVEEVDGLVEIRRLEEGERQGAAHTKGDAHRDQRQLCTGGQATAAAALGTRIARPFLQRAAVAVQACRVGASEAGPVALALPHTRPVGTLERQRLRRPVACPAAVQHPAGALDARRHAAANASVPAVEAEGALGRRLLVCGRARRARQALGLAARSVAARQAVGARPARGALGHAAAALEGAPRARAALPLAGGRLEAADLARVAQVHAAVRLVVACRARHALAQLRRLEPRLAAAAQVARHRQHRRRADHEHAPRGDPPSRAHLGASLPELERDLVLPQTRAECHEQLVPPRRQVHRHRRLGEAARGLRGYGREAGDARRKGALVTGDVARAGPRQLVADGQAVGVACGEGHLGETTEVEHDRAPRVLAGAGVGLAPHGGVGSDGGAHNGAHRQRHHTVLPGTSFDAYHAALRGGDPAGDLDEDVGRIAVGRTGLRQACRADR
eukprot:scaffold92282_cov75-Phaeocystis_antarctica.AAC.2